MKIKYSERETRLIVAWVTITTAIVLFATWSIQRMAYPRPPLIIDLLFPAVLAVVGVYMLRYKIPIESHDPAL